MTLAGLSDWQSGNYLDLAAAIADHSNQPDADLTAMWRRIAVFCAIHNIDDHFRNHGFLHRPGRWSLAPAFDVNPDPDPHKTRATSISGTSAAAEEREALFEVAPYFGVTRQAGADVLAQVDLAVASWRTVAMANGMSEHEQLVFTDVLPSI